MVSLPIEYHLKLCQPVGNESKEHLEAKKKILKFLLENLPKRYKINYLDKDVKTSVVNFDDQVIDNYPDLVVSDLLESDPILFIEIDGEYGHTNSKRQIIRDRHNDNYFKTKNMVDQRLLTEQELKEIIFNHLSFNTMFSPD